MTVGFKIGGKEVRPGGPCFIIGEVGQGHDGSLGMAHSYIDAIADSGADAVKFQTHLASAESTPAEPWRTAFSFQDSTRYEYWLRTAFTKEQWRGLHDHAVERGLVFLSSPFSPQALEMLTDIGVAGWKVASGEVNNLPLLALMADTSLPVLLSTGMSSWEEIDAAVRLLQGRSADFAVLQCTSMYPAPPAKVGLNVLRLFRDRYGCSVGISDHSGRFFTAFAAAAVGIDLLEVHVTFSRQMFGPDGPASVTTCELSTIVEGVRFIEEMKRNPVDKDLVAADLASLRQVFTKSIVAAVDLPAGTVLDESNLRGKKPGTGIPISRMHELIGKRLKRSVTADQALTHDDFSEG